MERSERWKRNSVLAMNTFGFTVMFAVWVVFAIIGLRIREELALGETEFAVLVALPVLTGSLLRLPVGMATDWWGGRPLFTGLLAFTAVPLLLLTVATAYWQYLVLGLFIGLAGTSFAVGIAYTSAWFPPRLQGTALGIFGAGNTGASLTKLLAPALMTVVPAGGIAFVPGGWRFVPFVYALAVLAAAAIYWSFTYTDHAHHFPDRVGAVGGLVGVIGGLGGFVMPILFGALAQRTGLPTTTFMFLFAVSLASLVWMIVVIHRVAREAAPRVAEELDSTERLAVAGAELAAGGELVFAEHLRRWQERRRAAVAAGSE